MKNTTKKPIVVEQDPESPMPKRLLAKEIANLGRSARELLSSGFERGDLISILRHRTSGQPTRADIAAVLDSIDNLGRAYAITE